ncbi:Hypothetical predicted protein [Octopus vulgaris]|uniref:Uncharacterized protein n=1 Tax=Octopus vulgaris TaxID=6645 RepID=A0AA36AY62_OCTVU|nr:Hypothetical predicted protein [Octopus vulgaris]
MATRARSGRHWAHCPRLRDHKNINVPPTRESPEVINPEQATLCDRILEVMFPEEKKRLPTLSCHRAKLISELRRANEVVMRISVKDTTKLNSLMHATTYVVIETMEMFREKKVQRNKEPFWRRKIEESIDT